MVNKTDMANYYIKLNNRLANLCMNCHFQLKYNYDSDKYRELSRLVSIPIPESYQSSAIEVVNPFLDNLVGLLEKIDDEIIRSFFIKVYSITKFKEDNLPVSECSSKIVVDNGDYALQVFVPKREVETNLVHAAIMHELAHFSLLYSNKPEFLEYSEVLSMFYEYLMHKEISDFFGDKLFIDNRMDMMRKTFSDLEQDLHFARRPELLGINKRFYRLPIAESVSYIDSLEYVLNLKDRRQEDKSYVDKHLGRIIIGEETFGELEKDLDFDVSKHEKILSLIK